MKNKKSLIAVIAVVFFFKIQVFSQEKKLFVFSGGVGIGIMEETSGNFNVGVSLDKFVSKRLSIGIGINQMATFKSIKENKTYYITQSDIEDIEKLDDFNISLFSFYLGVNYYFVKKDKHWLSLGFGPVINFYNEQSIHFVPSPYLNKSHVYISTTGKMYSIKQPMVVLNCDYTYFLNDKTGLNFRFFITESYGEKIALTFGLKTLL